MQVHNRIVVAFLFCLSASCVLRAESLPYRDSFESGDDVPSGWRQGAKLPGVSYVYDRSNASGGKRSLSIQKSANRYFPIAQWFKSFELTGDDKKLTVNAKVKAARATKSIIDLQFFDDSGSMINHEWVCYIGQKSDRDKPASHNWKEYTGTAVVPDGAKSVAVALQTYGPGKVWFDELAISSGSSGNADPAETPKARDESVTEIPKPRSLQLASGRWTRFIMLPPSASATKTDKGYSLLIVLPGGDGSIDFQSFVRSIHERALDESFVTVQMIAPPAITWPTKRTQARYATTVEAIDGVVAKLRERITINPDRVFALAWSSGGPAVYEALLRDQSTLKGALIAMSVFRPNEYPEMSAAAGKRVLLLHSPEDTVCPYSMAENANSRLAQAGLQTKLVDYPGGHGWRGPVFDLISEGISWLEQAE